MIQFGNDKIKDIYVGSDKIKEVYYGSELVYTAHDPRGYWVHKDTGVKTYFGLEDSSIEDGVMSPPSWRYDCSEVVVPLGVTALGEDCFMDCAALTSITLPEGLTSIGGRCFRYASLTSITLPESLTNIGGSCFAHCRYLTLVTALPATPPTIGYSIFIDVPLSSLSIKVHPPYVDDYKTATNWKNYASKISAI